MWINAEHYRLLNASSEEKAKVWNTCHNLQGQLDQLRSQKVKDDITIDWMRHRVNALEKQNAILLNKAAGVSVPVPEIVPTRPGTLTVPPQFESMPSFEDVGPDESQRLGIYHDKDGAVLYGVPGGAKPEGAID